jgi:Tfp pilus assembly protein PilF
MSIEEQLKAITATLAQTVEIQSRSELKHQALAESVELLHHEIRDLKGATENLNRAIEKDAENIRALARIAEIHEHRISSLEGPEGQP